MKLYLALFFCFISLAYANNPYSEWSLTKSSVKEGQALVIHGLNTKPEKMRDIIDAFNARGHDVLLLKLIGHNDDMNKMKRVTYRMWRSQLKVAYDLLSKKNSLEGGKKTIVGYSLGGVLAMDLISNNSQFIFHQAILFAPALTIKATSYFIKALGILGKGFVIPSFAPENYRAQSGTTIAAYYGLFDAISNFEKGDLKLLNIPTLIFMDKKDELVSYEGIEAISKKLEKWKMIVVNNKKSSIEKPYHHLIITPEALGQQEWNQVILPEFDKMLGKKI